MDLPDGVTPDMLAALQRGEDVRLPDGRHVRLVRAHSPLSGESGLSHVQVLPAESSGPPSVRLSPDYGAPSPLWPLSDAPDALGPEALLARLVAWQQDFDANFRWDSGWQSNEAKARWAAEAAVLVGDLRMALAGKAELVVDLWPLNAS